MKQKIFTPEQAEKVAESMRRALPGAGVTIGVPNEWNLQYRVHPTQPLIVVEYRDGGSLTFSTIEGFEEYFEEPPAQETWLDQIDADRAAAVFRAARASVGILPQSTIVRYDNDSSVYMYRDNSVSVEIEDHNPPGYQQYALHVESYPHFSDFLRAYNIAVNPEDE